MERVSVWQRKWAGMWGVAGKVGQDAEECCSLVPLPVQLRGDSLTDGVIPVDQVR